MVRHRAARWLAGAAFGLTLIGCQQGTDHLAAPESNDPIVVADVLSAEFTASLQQPATTTTAAPEPVPAEMVTPWQPPSTTSTTTTAPPPTVPPRSAAEPAPRKARVAAVERPAAAAQAPAATPPVDSGGASTIVSLTNRVRASAGLAPLQRSGSLDARAADWAQELAASGRLRHSSIPQSIVGNPWGAAGENVGSGPSVAVVHDALVNSSGHYANITGAAYTHIGVGVAVDGGGQVWVVEVFAG